MKLARWMTVKVTLNLITFEVIATFFNGKFGGLIFTGDDETDDEKLADEDEQHDDANAKRKLELEIELFVEKIYR